MNDFMQYISTFPSKLTPSTVFIKDEKCPFLIVLLSNTNYDVLINRNTAALRNHIVSIYSYFTLKVIALL